MWRSVGEALAEAPNVLDARFVRNVVHLCRHPRLMIEFLMEIGAERSIRTLIEEKLEKYARLSPEHLAATGADTMPVPPISRVRGD